MASRETKKLKSVAHIKRLAVIETKQNKKMASEWYC